MLEEFNNDSPKLSDEDQKVLFYFGSILLISFRHLQTCTYNLINDSIHQKIRKIDD